MKCEFQGTYAEKEKVRERERDVMVKVAKTHAVHDTLVGHILALATAFHHKQGTQDQGNSPRHNIQGTGVAVEVNDEKTTRLRRESVQKEGQREKHIEMFSQTDTTV